jgi:hypothetical protein
MNIKTALLLTLPLALFGCPEATPTAVTPTPTAPTGDPATPTPTPVPDPTFTVTLMDGDGQGDDVAGDGDGDTLTLVITDPPAGAWEFGYAQTQVGVGVGWFGEDCFTGDTCHAVPAPDATTNISTLVLENVDTIAEVEQGKMLLDVDEPESATPDLTYYIGAVGDADDTCFVFGHDVSYYSTLNCDTLGDDVASSNDVP